MQWIFDDTHGLEIINWRRERGVINYFFFNFHVLIFLKRILTSTFRHNYDFFFFFRKLSSFFPVFIYYYYYHFDATTINFIERDVWVCVFAPSDHSRRSHFCKKKNTSRLALCRTTIYEKNKKNDTINKIVTTAK